MSYKNVLFDWDGTLVQTLSIWRDALLRSLNSPGYNPDTTKINANYADFIAIAPALNITNQEQIKSIVNDARLLVREAEGSAQLYDGAASILGELSAAKVKIAIVTTSTHRQVDTRLRELGIDSLIDAVICGDDVTEQKPST